MRPTVLTVSSPLFYTESGGGDPVVLLHGLGADHRIWDAVRPVLAHNWRVFTPDMPGHGRSSLPEREVDLDLFARGLARWLDGLGIGPVRLVGHSLGGAVATTLAVERSDLVRSLVLVNPVMLTNQRANDSVIRSFRRFGFARLLGKPSAAETSRFLQNGLGIPVASITPEMVERWQETTQKAHKSLVAFTRELRVPAAHLAAHLPRVECPVVLLWGDKDALFPGPKAAEVVVERLRKGMNEFAETAHLPMAERPADFAGWLDMRLAYDLKPKE